MGIKLTRFLKLERCEVIGRVQIDYPRPDLMLILGNLESGRLQNPPERLLDYLEKLDLYRNGQVLKNGEQLISEGTISANEYCHYEIWYVRDDKWLGTIPVALRRIEAKRKNKDDKKNLKGLGQWKYKVDRCWQLSPEEKKPVIVQVAEDNSLHRLRFLDIDALLSQQSYENGKFKCVLESSTDDAEIKLTSNVKWSNDNGLVDIDVSLSWPAEKVISLLPEIVRQLRKGWDDKRNAIIEEDVPGNIDELTTFKNRKIIISDFCSENDGSFDTAEITNISLRAGSSRCAVDWLKQIMRHKWSKEYTSPHVCKEDQKEWLNSVALEEYGLEPLEGEKLLQAIDKNMASEAYWHVAALQDLVPPGVKTKNLEFTLKMEDQEPILTIARNIGICQDFTELRFIDRYVNEQVHIKMIEEICLQLGIKNVTIVSINEPIGLPADWHHVKMKKKSGENHDRYWCLKNCDHLDVWKVTMSLELLTYDNGLFKVKGPATFVPLEYEDVTPEIRNYIETNVE